MPRDFTICGLCDASCGIVVEHDGATVRSIRGDPDDPLSAGHVCPKALGLGDLHDDPDRVRTPLRRRGAEWDEISWEEALDEIADRFQAIQAREGRDAAAFWFGNPVAHSHSTLLALVPFARLLGSRNVFSANSLDAWPRMLVSLRLFGNQALLPVPDLERTAFLLIVGANPAVSNGSVMTAPGVRRRLAAIRARGGRIVVLDPRRTETAAVADEHYFLRPGSDALLLLAMVDVLFAERLVRLGALDDLVTGLDEVRRLAAGFPPERVAAATGMSAETIRDLARRFAKADSAVCYGRMGTCVQEFGTQATWLLDVLNVLTGNLNRAGGSMFTTPAVNLAGLAAAMGQTGVFGRWRSRVLGLPEFNGELPAAAAVAEMVTPGPGQVRALFSMAANPVLSSADGPRLASALAELEFFAAADLYINETTRHAHILLPALTPLECDRYPLLEPAMAVRNGARFAPAVLRRPAEALEDWQILVALAGRLARRRGGVWRLAEAAGKLVAAIGPNRLLDALLRVGPYRLSLGRLRRAPHGMDLGPLRPSLADRLRQRGRRVDLAPADIMRDLPALERLRDAPRDEHALQLVGRRLLGSMNSWLHNLERLTRGARCTLQMHPDDAERRGLAAGERVRIRSDAGSIEVVLEPTDEMMPGVVSLPFGWGHDRPGARLRVAERHPGASYNDLVSDRAIDRVSGTAALNGVPVTVTRA